MGNCAAHVTAVKRLVAPTIGIICAYKGIGAYAVGIILVIPQGPLQYVVADVNI